jgi:ATP-dependent DNA helicase RecG
MANPVFDTLAKVLILEREREYNNLTVSGGLDRLLANLIHKNNVALPMPLPAGGYESLSNHQRMLWINKCLGIIGGSLSGVNKSNNTRSKHIASASPNKQRNTSTTLNLNSPINHLSGIANNLTSKFKKLGITTIRDMLYTLPRRHNDFAKINTISSLTTDSEQTIIVNVWEAHQKLLGRRTRSTEAIVGDSTGNIRVVWFNQPYLAKTFKTGMQLVLSGRVSLFKGTRVIESPEYEILNDKEDLMHTGRIVPVYGLTEGISQRNMRKIVRTALDIWENSIGEFLPPSIIKRTGLMSLPDAIRQAHYPDDEHKLLMARRRLAFDELFIMQLYVFSKRKAWRESEGTVKLHPQKATLIWLLNKLAFNLTNAQTEALKDIIKDIENTRPMSRLLQGDVGSGKTIIAMAALISTAANGYQSAMMAPTEILAQQHYQNISRLLDDSKLIEKNNYFTFNTGDIDKTISVGILLGSQTRKEKKEIQELLSKGTIDIILGTHAIIQPDVDIPQLALAVVDEQHRFGVMQRSELRSKGGSPHLLVMSATPIPRSLALTLYGDLDISVLDELPEGRQKIETRLIEPASRNEAYKFLRSQITLGRQVFVVCPIIEESDTLQVRAATTEYIRLSENVFPDLSVDLIHGRMKIREKEEVIEKFRNGKTAILVSTPVIEVGIDIPNASVILIEGADRFGLAQLHQFRGRVGRGKNKSYCLLITESQIEQTVNRLRIMENMDNGFSVAEEDLKFRGPGDYFGTRQSGLPDLRVARLSDTDLLTLARQEASRLLIEDPNLNNTENADLMPMLNKYPTTEYGSFS